MPRSRQDPTQQPPDEATDHSAFPHRTATTRRRWYRNHTLRADESDGGAWWFSSSVGRFDLPAPDGTCYLASTPEAAAMELVGPSHTANGWVPADLLEGRVVSLLRLPSSVRAADCADERAREWRITNELTSTSAYAVTQAWARVFRRDGFGGVLAALRFSPGDARGLAVFGEAGAPSPAWSGDESPVAVAEIVGGLGVRVVEPPGLADVEVVRP